MELKDRLRSFKTAASKPAARFEKPAPLPYLTPLENSFGLTYYLDKIYIEHHGQLDLKCFPEIPYETLRFLSLDRSLVDFSIRDALFLDIETTGTAGGAGTIAFLVGLGFVEDGYFQIRQFFLHDLAQELSFLDAIAEFCSRFRYLVTYNGKTFDSQILRTRYLLHRRADPLAGKAHIDMLFIARRLWKRRWQDCNLGNLERQVLGFERIEDIPSYMIPSAYTDYLRYANGNMIQKVLHHNQWDIASLAVLTARASRLPSAAEGLSAEEHISLSMLYERHKQYASAIEHQLKALQHGSEMRRRALFFLARNLRRVRDLGQMKWLLRQVENESLDQELCRRLCILCEHDLQDYDLALRLVELQLHRIEKFQGLSKKEDPARQEWQHRRTRLIRKMRRTTPLLE